MDTTKFTYFVLIRPNMTSFSFLASWENPDGETKEIVEREENGRKVFRRFRWGQQNRAIRIPNKHQKVIEFLREHPFCEGSPWRTERSGEAYYKELNDAKAANAALEAKRIRSKAETIALKLTEDEVKEMAYLIGEDGNKDISVLAHSVAEFAGNNPVDFMNMYEDKARAARSLFNKAKRAGHIKNKGFMVYWENVHIGNGDEKAIERIFEDEALYEAIKERLERP